MFQHPRRPRPCRRCCFSTRKSLRLDLPWLTDVTRAQKPVRLPTVLTRDETQRLLGGIDDPLVGLIVRLLYDSGMRLLECLRLRVRDVDFERGEIVQELLGHSDVKTNHDRHPCAEPWAGGGGQPVGPAARAVSARSPFRPCSQADSGDLNKNPPSTGVAGRCRAASCNARPGAHPPPG